MNISEMLEGAELFETSSIKIKESLKYSIDIHILLEEMKYGIGWVRYRVKFIKVTRPSFFGGVPFYFEALWYPHLYFYHKYNT